MWITPLSALTSTAGRAKVPAPVDAGEIVTDTESQKAAFPRVLGWREWLAGPAEAAREWLVPPPDDALRAWPVDRRVGHSGVDDPGLILPVAQ